jgi:hypothetical protein
MLLLSNWKIKIYKLFLGRSPKPVFKNPYAPSTDSNGKVIPPAAHRIALSFPFLEECVKVVKEDKIAVQNRFTWSERILAPVSQNPSSPLVSGISDPTKLKEDLRAWLRSGVNSNERLSLDLDEWLQNELTTDTKISDAIDEWLYEDDVKELEDAMKPVKFTNAEIRARLVFKWKKKIYYWLCHQWHFWKGCNGCKENSPCERFRKQKMFSGN